MNWTSFAKKAGIVFLFCFVVVAVFLATPASAYVPLAPSIVGAEQNEEVDPGNFFSSLITFAIGFSGVLAVLVIVWGGVSYITAAGDTNKVAAGRERITSAILGLILVLTSWLILNTINRELVQLNLNIRGVGSDATFTTGPQEYCYGLLPEGETNPNESEVDVRCGFQTQQACQQQASSWEDEGRTIVPCGRGAPGISDFQRTQSEQVPEYCYGVAPEGESNLDNAIREGNIEVVCEFEDRQACSQEVDTLREQGRRVIRCQPGTHLRDVFEGGEEESN